MEHITVVFARSRHPLSYLIRAFTWARWSHVGVIMPDNTIIESIAGKGVIVSTLQDFKKRNKQFHICQLPVRDRQDALRLLRKEVGKPYDMTAIYSLVMRSDWQEADSWFCSELIAHACGFFRNDYIKRITPEDLWRISSG